MDWSSKPWMRPTMYTNDVDPSHGPQPKAGNVARQPARQVVEHSAEDVEAMIRGEQVLDRVERQPLHDLGDGRPDPSRSDRTPMVYKKAYSDNNEIDIDERDYIDTSGPPPEYVPIRPAPPIPIPLATNEPTNNTPSAPHERAGTFQPPQAVQGGKDPAPTGNPVTLKSILPRAGKSAILVISLSRDDYQFTPDEAEAISRDLMSWANAARLIKL